MILCNNRVRTLQVRNVLKRRMKVHNTVVIIVQVQITENMARKDNDNREARKLAECHL